MRSGGNPHIIYFHGNDWNGVPARQRYLMQAMSTYLPVIFLDGTPERRGRVSVNHPTDRVTVVKGLVSLLIALERRRLGRFGSILARWHLRRLIPAGSDVIFWNAENWTRPYRFVPHTRLVFDSIDPCFSADAHERTMYDARETEVIRAADVVFASADALVDQCKKSRPDVHLLNNACEPQEYAQDLVASASRPEWWPAEGKSIAAFLGSLDWRFDFDMVERVCRATPEVTFVLAGNVVGESVGRVATLSALPNVVCPGRISVEAGRYLLAHCDVGLIPFTPGQMNDAINPVKLYAYALLGKPIVGTAIRELQSRSEVVAVARDPEEFSAAVVRAVRLSADEQTRSRLREFALRNTWDARAKVAWAALEPLLSGSRQ